MAPDSKSTRPVFLQDRHLPEGLQRAIVDLIGIRDQGVAREACSVSAMYPGSIFGPLFTPPFDA
jgi:hypothetical protein